MEVVVVVGNLAGFDQGLATQSICTVEILNASHVMQVVNDDGRARAEIVNEGALRHRVVVVGEAAAVCVRHLARARTKCQPRLGIELEALDVLGRVRPAIRPGPRRQPPRRLRVDGARTVHLGIAIVIFERDDVIRRRRPDALGDDLSE